MHNYNCNHTHVHHHPHNLRRSIIPLSATEETVVELAEVNNEKEQKMPHSSSSLVSTSMMMVDRKDPKQQMQTVVPPPLITKDLISSSAASYIWNEQVYNVKDPEYYFNGPVKSGFSRRGACNLCTIAFVATVILFMFAYPLSMFFLKQNTK